MGTPKKRIFYYDEIRALAILLIISVHTYKWFIPNQPAQSLLLVYTKYFMHIDGIGVQLFFMISGALLLNRKYQIGDFLKRRFSRIFVPFIFWIIIVVLFRIFIMGHSSTIEGIISIVFYEGYVWFVWTIMGLYLFVPVINSFINQYGVKGCEYFLAIWLFTTILMTLNLYPIQNVELRYFSGFIGYMILGWYLSNKEFKSISNKTMMMFGIALFLISILVGVYFNYNSIPFGSEWRLSIISILETSGLYLAIKYAADYSQEKTTSLTNKIYSFLKDSYIGKLIYSLSICSYGIYLTHYFPIWTFQIIDKTAHIFSRNPFKWEPLLFLIVLGFSWGLILILSKIPYLKKISGT